MEVFIEKTGKKKRIRYSGKAIGLLNSLKINSEAVLVIKNGELVTEEDILDNNDKVRIMSVISGG